MYQNWSWHGLMLKGHEAGAVQKKKKVACWSTRALLGTHLCAWMSWCPHGQLLKQWFCARQRSAVNFRSGKIKPAAQHAEGRGVPILVETLGRMGASAELRPSTAHLSADGANACRALQRGHSQQLAPTDLDLVMDKLGVSARSHVFLYKKKHSLSSEHA